MTDLTYAMPCYNHSQYLVEALDSIKADIGTHNLEYQLLIIDDGSTDDSVDVIDAWHSQNPQINLRLIKQVNHGIAKTVNKLYNTSEGQFVRLCASDDTIVAGSSAAMITAAKYDDKIECVFGDGIVIDNDSKHITDSFITYHGGNPSRFRDNVNIPDKLIANWCIAGPCILVRRRFFEAYQYDENSRIDDFDFFLNLFKKQGAVFYLDEQVCAYRIHATNTSKVKDVPTRIKNLQSFCYLIEKYLNEKDLAYLKALLKSKRYLTKCKINFLKKEYIRAVINFGLSKFYSLVS